MSPENTVVNCRIYPREGDASITVDGIHLDGYVVVPAEWLVGVDIGALRDEALGRSAQSAPVQDLAGASDCPSYAEITLPGTVG